MIKKFFVDMAVNVLAFARAYAALVRRPLTDEEIEESRVW